MKNDLKHNTTSFDNKVTKIYSNVNIDAMVGVNFNNYK